MHHDDQRLIHIMGMYKSGTSWLLHVLAAHPELIAWREFDIIRATYANEPGPIISRADGRLRRFFRLPPRTVPGQSVRLREREEIIRELFLGRGLLPVMDEQSRQDAERFSLDNADQFLERLMALGEYQLQADDAPLMKPEDFDNTLGVGNMRRSDLRSFIEAVRDMPDLAGTPGAYFRFLQNQSEPQAPVVLKAADQIMCFSQLQSASPDSTKIVVMRDGRDAAISALHYGRLMEKWDAPWKPKELSYMDRLNAWSTRAAALAYHCDRHDILVLRYEDMKRDFHALCRSLFRRLNLAHDDLTIDAIHAKTNFKTVSGGRKPGEAAEHIVRKGITGEWKDTLTEREQAVAWRLAQKELSTFGYTQDGSYVPTHYCDWYQ